MDKQSILDEIFANDPLGLLQAKSSRALGRTPDERLASSFHEITEFVAKHGREPSSNVANVFEHQLHNRLKSFRQDPEKAELLQDLDTHGLLQKAKPAPKAIQSIDDIFSDDSLGLLGDGDASLFDYKHIPKEITMPEYVARRKPCKDFAQFEHFFIACQNELSAGIRKLIPFKNEQQINDGCFYVLHGVLLYVVAVGKRELTKGKQNARLRCIFENGTESDMMLRSLAAELYKDGRRITANEDELLQGFGDITPQDEATGYIYVLSSLSQKPEIANMRNLYKIGYASTSVAERIKNAENEPTYLMAKVKIESSFRCYNMNPQKLESLLHRFFGKSCLNIDVFDAAGQRYSPREWFIAPLEVIEQAIAYVVNGEIVNMYYEAESGLIRYMP